MSAGNLDGFINGTFMRFSSLSLRHFLDYAQCTRFLAWLTPVNTMHVFVVRGRVTAIDKSENRTHFPRPVRRRSVLLNRNSAGSSLMKNRPQSFSFQNRLRKPYDRIAVGIEMSPCPRIVSTGCVVKTTIVSRGFWNLFGTEKH